MNKFEDIQVGDTVLLHNKHSTLPDVTQIIKVTQTQIVTNLYNMRFRRSTGIQIGPGKWAIYYITIPDEDELEVVREHRRRQNLINIIQRNTNSIRIQNIPTSILEQIYNLVQQQEHDDV